MPRELTNTEQKAVDSLQRLADRWPEPVVSDRERAAIEAAAKALFAEVWPSDHWDRTGEKNREEHRQMARTFAVAYNAALQGGEERLREALCEIVQRIESHPHAFWTQAEKSLWQVARTALGGEHHEPDRPEHIPAERTAQAHTNGDCLPDCEYCRAERVVPQDDPKTPRAAPLSRKEGARPEASHLIQPQNTTAERVVPQDEGEATPLQRLEDLAAKRGRSMAQVIEDAGRIDREWREQVVVCQRCGHAQEQPEPVPPVPQDEEEAREKALASCSEQHMAEDGDGALPDFMDGWFSAREFFSTHPSAPKDAKRYIAWLCEGCDECNPPDGSERCQGPCNSPSLNGAEVVRAEDYDRVTAPERDALIAALEDAYKWLKRARPAVEARWAEGLRSPDRIAEYAAACKRAAQALDKALSSPSEPSA